MDNGALESYYCANLIIYGVLVSNSRYKVPSKQRSHNTTRATTNLAAHIAERPTNTSHIKDRLRAKLPIRQEAASDVKKSESPNTVRFPYKTLDNAGGAGAFWMRISDGNSTNLYVFDPTSASASVVRDTWSSYREECNFEEIDPVIPAPLLVDSPETVDCPAAFFSSQKLRFYETVNNDVDTEAAEARKCFKNVAESKCLSKAIPMYLLECFVVSTWLFVCITMICRMRGQRNHEYEQVEAEESVEMEQKAGGELPRNSPRRG
jgi:hypothetical protein